MNIPGDETATGQWKNPYKVQFTFHVGGRQYVFAQNLSTKYWFIQEFLPGGKMGAETDNGSWKNPYEVQFPFVINGHQYFYGQNLSLNRWFIQKLLPGGKMGSETATGHWKNPYAVQFPFVINDRQYFYGQNLSLNRWFIQELLPEGKMGAQTATAHWNNPYAVQFPFVINGHQYFYGQNLSSKHWFIQELLPEGKMGSETDSGNWKNPYGTQFAYPKLIHGHLFFYAQNLETNYWFVQELLLGNNGKCKMGDEVANGTWKYSYEIQLPFALGDVAYFYGNKTHGIHNWFIQELISRDQYSIWKIPSVEVEVEVEEVGYGNKTLSIPKEHPTYAVGWLPYLADWKNYIKNYGLCSGLRYHDPSKIPGVGVLVGTVGGELHGDQMYNNQSEILFPYKQSEGHYSWALVPGASIMYVWNPQLKLEQRNYVRHSDLNEGMPVVCAGEFQLNAFPVRLDGLYIELNDSSGHYKPEGKKCFSFVIDAFKRLGVDTSEVKVQTRKP